MRGATERPIVDVVVLAVMIAVGGAAGLACGHTLVSASTSTPMPAPNEAVEALCAYGGAATVVGFGLVNRTLRSTMFVVPIGAPIALLIVVSLSLVVGYVALPFVIAWRVWALVARRRGSKIRGSAAIVSRFQKAH